MSARDRRARAGRRRGRRLAALIGAAVMSGGAVAGRGGAESPLPGGPATGAGGAAGAGEAASGDVARGRRVFAAAGGCTCHTDYPGRGDEAPWLAGGRGLSTPFGTYYSTNITPDPETGLGAMSEADFVRAMREGLSPDGRNYFPVFPYTSFTRMTDDDLRDLWAYLRTVPPVRAANRDPDVSPPFGWRWTITFWKWLEFSPGRFVPDPERDAAWNRGAYLVAGPGHCGECHTPRTVSGGIDRALWLAGSSEGPEGELAPNITPDDATGIGEWSEADIAWYLETGFKPDGDDTQGLMAEVIEHGFSALPASDRRAIARYLRSLPPIEHRVRARD